MNSENNTYMYMKNSGVYKKVVWNYERSSHVDWLELCTQTTNKKRLHIFDKEFKKTEMWTIIYVVRMST